MVDIHASVNKAEAVDHNPVLTALAAAILESYSSGWITINLFDRLVSMIGVTPEEINSPVDQAYITSGMVMIAKVLDPTNQHTQLESLFSQAFELYNLKNDEETKLPSFEELILAVTPIKDLKQRNKDLKKEMKAHIEAQSLADKLALKNDELESISKELKVRYKDLYSSGQFTSKECDALAEGLMRVPEEIRKAKMKNLEDIPSRLYLWVISKSNIMFPYVSLKVASENIKTHIRPETRWGFRPDGSVVLPKKECFDISNLTYFIRMVIEAFTSVSYTADTMEHWPELKNETCTLDSNLSTIFKRILDLKKSPESATIRKGSKLSKEDEVKNAIDFIVLNKRYNDNASDYGHLLVNTYALSCGRRAEKVSQGHGKSASYHTILSGYKLSDYISPFLDPHTFKTIEEHPFVRLVIDLIKKIPGSHIPKSFFDTPSNSLKSKLRKGPVIKIRGKPDRINNYVPFSFAKSSDCDLMPKSCRTTLTDLGATVYTALDHINKLEIKEANNASPLYEKFLKTAYQMSDDMRDTWQKRAEIPDLTAVERWIQKIGNWNMKDLNDLEISVNTFAHLKLRFEPADNDALRQDDIRRHVLEHMKKKLDSRKRV
jgi:hypothetical protein